MIRALNNELAAKGFMVLAGRDQAGLPHQVLPGTRNPCGVWKKGGKTDEDVFGRHTGEIAVLKTEKGPRRNPDAIKTSSGRYVFHNGNVEVEGRD